MKNSDVYPSASEEDLKHLPPQVRFYGLHPLVWVAIVVLLIAVGRACSTVEDLGCGWDWWERNNHESEQNSKSDGDKDTDSAIKKEHD